MVEKKLQSFKDLNVWQKSSDLAILVYKITEKFPRSELYGLTNQMRRAVVSISSNIAEGFKRNHKKEKLQFYNLAYSSAAELESQIEISYKLTYLSAQDYQKLISLTIEVAKMVDGLIKSVSKSLNSKFNFLFFFIFLYSISYILSPSFTSAAVLYLEPSSGEYHQGDIFKTDVRLDTEGETVNTCQVQINFPAEQLEITNISDGGAILNLWAKAPTFSNDEGNLSFIGGIPGGFSGEGKLISIIFRALERDGLFSVAPIILKENSKVLLNDGLGTPAKLNLKDAIFTILPEKSEIQKNEWQEEIEKDKIPPEPFKIEINQNPTIFEGKYFISFSTIDKQSGIDRYEIREVPRILTRSTTKWKIGESPYLLEDQSLKSKIFVKAVDKAGNEQISEISPSRKPFPYWIIILVLGVGIIWWLIKKYSTKLHK